MSKYIILFAFIVMSCAQEKKEMVNLSEVEVDLQVQRFDEDFYTNSPENLEVLKSKYPLLFPPQFPDSVWVNKMTDQDEQELFAETQKLYKDFEGQKQALTELFKHIKYYFPSFKEPKIITLLTNIDPNSRVILADTLMLISLDHYLGEAHEFYGDFPKYIKRNNTPDHLIVDVANEFAKQIVPSANDNSFVSRMVQEGKRIYLLEQILPQSQVTEIMGFNPDQIQWLQNNEADVWKYFIENGMLFSNEAELSERFIFEGPFSKFYLANDQESPGGLGKWFGWTIVSRFQENENLPLLELLSTSNETIFKKSKYKPKKG